MEITKEKIGIIGVGVVGGALKKWYESQGHQVFLHDVPKNIGSKKSVNHADIIFIAVPTPHDPRTNKFDSSYIESAFANISSSRVVVIRSTVLPGTTARMQAEFLQHKVLFSPEFLTQSQADKDIFEEKLSIIGYTPQSRDVAGHVLHLLPRAPFRRALGAHEAELFKYIRNNFFSAKVIFFNQIFDLCQKLGADYNAIRDCVTADPWIGGMHTDVWHGGYRGYGGKCFPKDIRSMISFAQDAGAPQLLLEVVEEINNQLLKNQGIEEAV